jgi:hypothetical protein
LMFNIGGSLKMSKTYTVSLLSHLHLYRKAALMFTFVCFTKLARN